MLCDSFHFLPNCLSIRLPGSFQIGCAWKPSGEASAERFDEPPTSSAAFGGSGACCTVTFALSPPAEKM
jgi:hypothetical protein